MRNKEEEEEETEGKEMGAKSVWKTLERVHTIWDKIQYQLKLERPKIHIWVWIQAIEAQFKQKAFVNWKKNEPELLDRLNFAVSNISVSE